MFFSIHLISSIVVDNATTNDAMMNVLMDKLETSSLILGGDFVHMRCSAHILNLIVRDRLVVIDFAICKVRALVEKNAFAAHYLLRFLCISSKK